MIDYLLSGLVFTVVGYAFRLAVCPKTLLSLAIAGGSSTSVLLYKGADTCFKHTAQVASIQSSQILFI